jgi:hypothetical protein
MPQLSIYARANGLAAGVGRKRSHLLAGSLISCVMIAAAAIPSGASNHRQSPAAAYLAAAAKVNTQESRFYSSIEFGPTVKTLTKSSLALAASLEHFETALAHIRWKGGSARDARSLERYVKSFSQFLQTAKYQSQSTIGSWRSQLSVIGGAGTAPIATLRNALGLRRLKVSTTSSTTTTLPATTTTTTTIPIYRVGQSQEITFDGGDTVSMTLDRVIDPAADTNGFTQTQDGNRFVALEFTVVNQGSTAINQSFDDNVTVYDANGQGFSGFSGEAAAGPSFPNGLVDVAPNGTASGWVLIEVRLNDPISTVTYSPFLSGNTATWTL